MTEQHQLSLQISFGLSTRAAVTEQQIRNYLITYRFEAETRIANIIAGAPPTVEASLIDTSWDLDVTGGDGVWRIDLDLMPTIQVADQITSIQVRNYFAGYKSQAQQLIRDLIRGAESSARAKIVDWHFCFAGIDEIEP